MMEIEQHEMENCDVFRVSGRIDSSNAKEFENALTARVDEGRTNIVVNLKEVEYMSSAALRALVATFSRAQNHPDAPGKLVLARARPEVYEIFVLAAFTSLFTFYDDEKSACASFAKAKK